MLPEIGQWALVLALVIAFIQGAIPVFGVVARRQNCMKIAESAALLQFVLVALAFATLMHAYIVSDFSVVNVATNSHSAKPLLYKISGLWGNHEGSMLLWVTTLALFGATFALMGRRQGVPSDTRAMILAVQGMIGFGFLLFTILTSNPLERLPLIPPEGNGLNPILQDPGLAFHPPVLYIGYVGFSLTFAFAVAGLVGGRVDSLWACWLRPWVLFAWSMLGLGIVLGSRWAYYTLGWGGWWFWDPVENVSLMPWLTGTALLHSLVILERRGTLRRWTVLLAIGTFALSLVGAFVVRSGVLTSVHAFSLDPDRGVFIMMLFLVIVGLALILYAYRAVGVGLFARGEYFALLSRESAILVNNLLLTTAVATVFIGTFYPLILEVMGLGRVFVGAPYYEATIVPLLLPMIVLMGVAPMLAWKRSQWTSLLKRLWLALTVTLIALLSTWTWQGAESLMGLAAVAIACWTITATLHHLAQRVSLGKVALADSLRRAGGLPLSFWGMSLAHGGLAIAVLGMTGSGVWMTERIVALPIGESIHVNDYRIELLEVESLTGDNYQAEQAHIRIWHRQRELIDLYPQRRYFPSADQLVPHPVVYSGGLDEVVIVLGENNPNTENTRTIRVFHHPLITLLWLGGIMIALGGVVSLCGGSVVRPMLVSPTHPPQ